MMKRFPVFRVGASAGSKSSFGVSCPGSKGSDTVDETPSLASNAGKDEEDARDMEEGGRCHYGNKLVVFSAVKPQ